MGLTIHYNLRSAARWPQQAWDMVARLRGPALDLPFERVDDIVELQGSQCDYEECDRDHPHRWLLIQAGQYLDDPKREGYSYRVSPTHVIAFSTLPGPGCEEANFGLCRYPAAIEVDDLACRSRKRRIATGLRAWSWGSFCKTQYASDTKCGGVANFLRCHLAVIKMLDHARKLGILERVSDEGGFWERRDVKALAQEVGQWNETIAALAGQLRDWFGDEVVAQITRYPDFEHLEAKGRA